MTLNYGVRWEPWFPQQHDNGAVYNFSPDRFRAGQRSTVFPQAPPGFTYPGDEGFPNGKAGMYTGVVEHRAARRPRVGSERRRPHVGARRLRHEQRVRQRAVLHQRRQRAAVGLGGAPDAAAASARSTILRAAPASRIRSRSRSTPTRRSRRTARSSRSRRISTRRACIPGTSASSGRLATTWRCRPATSATTRPTCGTS